MAMATQSISGLISGLDTANIVKSLMTIERRPVQQLQNRIDEHKVKIEAYRGVNNLLLDFASKVTRLAKNDLWTTFTTSSTNESVLKATANSYAEEGSYTFRVGRLAQAAQYMSTGFASRTSGAVSPSGGTIRIDSAQARVDRSLPVEMLNGGKGIYHGQIKITDKAGNSAVIDLSTAYSLQDVLDAINNANGINVTASLNTDNENDPSYVIGDRLVITDHTGGTGTLKIENYGGSTTATDLGLAGKTASGAGNTRVTGDRIYYLGGRTSLAALRDGLGINNGTPGTIRIEDSIAGTFYVDLSRASTVQDVMDTIASATGGKVTAAIGTDGRSLTLTSTDGGTLTVTSLSAGDTTAEDLGLASGTVVGATLVGRRILGDPQSVQIAWLSGADTSKTGLNGARNDLTRSIGALGVRVNGNPAIDLDVSSLTGADSLIDLVTMLNKQARDQGLSLTFRINDVGNGILAENNSNDVYEIVADSGGSTLARDLGFLNVTLAAGARANGGDLDRNYISRATALATLNGGQGVAAGYLRITNSNGISGEISVASTDTMGKVIDAINNAGLGVLAQINKTGDGIALVDTLGGTQPIVVADVYGGTTAKDLGLLGSGSGILDGSFERAITVAGTDTLTDVMNKIGTAGLGLRASIINSGSSVAPYRLVVEAGRSGSASDFILDTNIASLAFTQSSRGLDSLLLYGQSGSSVSPLLLTSPTNTNTTAVLGLSLQLQSVSSQPVTVTVSRNTEEVQKAIEEMVDAYNALNDLVAQLDTYDTEKKEAGILFGDSAVRSLMQEISEVFFQTVKGVSGASTFYDIGITFDRKGKLELNTSTLSEMLSSNFTTVRDLLTLSTDVARSTLNASASSNVPAASGFNVQNLLNGDTSVKTFGAANGFESANAIDPQNGTSITVRFDKARMLNRLTLHHFVNPDAPSGTSGALRDFLVEYFNASTQKWETLRQVQGNIAAQTYLGFRVPTPVSELRITATQTNAADGKFRLVEIEAMEAQGLASQMQRVTNRLTDSLEGFFAREEESLTARINEIQSTIDRMNERLENVELNYIRKFSAMEAALAQLQSQGDFFAQHMDAINAKNKK